MYFTLFSNITFLPFQICDANLNILHVDASFGGASHDSYVWNQCAVKQYLERLEINGEHCWLLGIYYTAVIISPDFSMLKNKITL